MKIPLDKVVYSTPPSAVVLVSTISKEGRKNIAPFGFFMPCAHQPPMVAVSIRKTIHTYKYAKEIGEFVVSIPTSKIVKQVYKAGGVNEGDEFKGSGLTAIPSNSVKPFSVKECQVNLECRFVDEITTGDHVIIIGKVIDGIIDDTIFNEDNAILRTNLDSIYHATKNNFVSKGKKIE
ncbi:MAG: flavin reductase family protein [Candidatus Woesearchaeota archaeon]|nr:MAG: flavin reductase family protein [Candidatus Woesearchaeota archaeon]